MTIIKINSSAAAKGTEALVLVENGPLTDFLGDAEGASHEDWNSSGMDRIEQNWKKSGSKGRVDFCRRIVDKFIEQLNPPSDVPDYDLLSDFFFVDRNDAPQRGRSRGKETATTGAATVPRVESPPKWFVLYEKKGGFRLTRNKSVTMPPRQRLRISAAYDVACGNPLKKWSVFDFDFKKDRPGGWRGNGIKILNSTGNTIDIEIENESFYLENTNFDKYRDLFIRVDEIETEGTTNGKNH